MISDRKLFSYSFVLFILILLIILILLAAEAVKPVSAVSIFLAAGITLINFILGITSIITGINKPAKKFIQIFIGGMIFRLFLILGIIFICLKFLDISQINFIFSIFFFYIFFLIIELIYLNFRKNTDA